MKIYQRMLYIGLGGTGLKIGTQLEQRLRAELCGADGQRLTRQPAFQQLQAFELPQFVQFVYADYDDAAREAAEQASQRATRSAVAARNTAIYVNNLTPPANSYAKVAESLRTGAAESVRGWLPKADNEPQVAPLSIGAGQYPTVGRAALFGTFHSAGGIEPVETPLREAVKRLSLSGGALDAMLGHTPRAGCDVFIGFSVAGGTGTGIFYDFMRIAADVASAGLGGSAEEDGDVRIYPLVVLPSAFDVGQGGGRAADLNGGPALRELFDMINSCNAGTKNTPMPYPGDKAQAVGIDVPVQTAFLFRRPDALTIEDLHRSIVAFVLAMVGTETKEEQGTRSGSFASWFVNQAGKRREPAPDGIGRRPASTALAGQLTIPLAEISEILGARLVAQATRDLQKPRNENNRDLIQSFVSASGLGPLQTRAFDDALPPFPPDLKGAREIFGALTGLRQNALQQHRSLRNSLQTRVATMAQEFDWGQGIKSLAAQHDLFRVARVALGDPRLSDTRINQEGVAGFVRRRGERHDPPSESGFGGEPPTAPQLDNKLLGFLKAKMSDAEVRQYIQAINDWYDWRTKAEWHEVWGQNAEIWRPSAERMRAKIDEIMSAFANQAQNEAAEFQAACQSLYQPRTGVVYFLPDGGTNNDLDQFFTASVLPKLRERLSLGEGAEAGQILNRIMGRNWLDAYEATAHAPGDQALQYVRDRVEEEIYAILARDDEKPILPRLKTLLAAIATEQDGAAFPAGLMERFRNSLAALLPAGFSPGGTTDLSVQVFYPADGPNPAIENFLARTVLGGRGTAQFNQIEDANFLGIVLTRTELWATGVEEFRSLMQIWGDALDNPRPGDDLPWRQRLGYDARWIVLSKEDRSRVLLSFLNAMWDGSVEVVSGSEESPERIRVTQYDAPGAPPVEFDLKPYGKMSRWTTLLRAYERYTLSEDSAVAERCAQLVKRVAPTGVTDDPGQPSALYGTFIGLIPKQQQLARETYDSVAEAARGQAKQAVEFWCETVPEALRREFTGGGGPMGRNHEELLENVHAAEPVV